MPKIQYSHDKTGNQQEVQGSDNRLNVSSRADARAYYNSRDEEQCYTVVWKHLAASDGELGFYLKNTNVTKSIVVSSIGINSDTADSRFTLWFVEGVAGDGVAVIPTNLNRMASRAADAEALESAAGTSISGLTLSAKIDFLHASGHEEFRLSDRIRLGQNDAIAVVFEENSAGTADAGGVIYFYYEDE